MRLSSWSNVKELKKKWYRSGKKYDDDDDEVYDWTLASCFSRQPYEDYIPWNVPVL